MLGVEQDAERLGRADRRAACRRRRSATPAACAHSAQITPICARRVDRADAPAPGPGATSITSSTMRFSRSTFSVTIFISWRCAGSVASSASSALACEIAASGFLISWAMPAETRPIAASFSWRLRACTLRTSSRKRTQNSSLAGGSRFLVKRTRTRSVRCDSGVNWIAHVAAGLGPRRLGEGALDRAHQRAPGRNAAQLERRGAAHPFGREQAPRRRIGGADLAGAVDDEDAVFHLLDHEPVELRLLARHLEAAARAQLLAREPAGELAGEHGDDEEAAAGEARLRHQQRRVAAARPGRARRCRAAPASRRRRSRGRARAASARRPSAPAGRAARRS